MLHYRHILTFFTLYHSQRFYCGGRLIFGPDVTSLPLTILLIAGPSVVFTCQVIAKIHKSEKFAHDEHADKHSKILGYPVLVFTIFLTVAVSMIH